MLRSDQLQSRSTDLISSSRSPRLSPQIRSRRISSAQHRSAVFPQPPLSTTHVGPLHPLWLASPCSRLLPNPLPPTQPHCSDRHWLSSLWYLFSSYCRGHSKSLWESLGEQWFRGQCPAGGLCRPISRRSLRGRRVGLPQLQCGSRQDLCVNVKFEFGS